MIATAIAPSKPNALTRIEKIIEVRKRNKEARYEKIRERFNHLYNVDRRRIEDCYEIVSTEFGIAKSTVLTILKS